MTQTDALPEFLQTANSYLTGIYNKRQTRALYGPLEFLVWLRGHCPKPGEDWVKAILVTVKSKDAIPEHEHPEHTILYYVEPAGVPVIVEGMERLPAVGEVIYLPPNTRHCVPRNMGEKTRVSVAMLVGA